MATYREQVSSCQLDPHQRLGLRRRRGKKAQLTAESHGTAQKIRKKMTANFLYT